MKVFKLSLLVTAAMFVAVCAQAQTVDDIINKYIDAIGGRELISKVKSLHIESETYVEGNRVETDSTISVTPNSLTFGAVDLIVGKAWKSEETDFSGLKNIQCVTDTGGWTVNWIMNVINKTSKPQAMAKELYNYSKVNLKVGGLLMNYAEIGCKAELVGKETVDSISAYKIKLTLSNSESDFYIDANTYYLIKTEFGTEKTPIVATTTYSDYRKTDIGFTAFRMITSMPNGVNATTTITKVVANPEIDPKIFEKPE